MLDEKFQWNASKVAILYIRITFVFLAEKRRKSKLFRILPWITFILTIFQKDLAKKSYSTFSYRFSMTWAAAAPIKTKIFQSSSPPLAVGMEPRANKPWKPIRKSWITWQVLFEKWLKYMWFRAKFLITFLSFVFLARKPKVILFYIYENSKVSFSVFHLVLLLIFFLNECLGLCRHIWQNMKRFVGTFRRAQTLKLGGV